MSSSISGNNASHGAHQRYRISIVDDDASIRQAIARLCKSSGYHVKAYASAEAFLEASEVADTHLLIVDLHLPGKSGLDLQREVLTTNKSIPLVMITASEDPRAREQALENGAIAFLRKPSDGQRLLELIAQALH